MPLYSFKCSKCEHTFDQVLKIDNRKEPILLPCDECGEDGSIYRTYEIRGYIDPGILKADRNLERSGVLKELNRMKEHHKYMIWKG